MSRDEAVSIVSFSNETREDRKWLKQFVDFHWRHYVANPQYVPLLDYEYLGFKPLGIIGFFEPKNLFFKHAGMRFFMAFRGNEPVGRCNAFVNHNHNAHWKDKVGFFGQFESVDDQSVAGALLGAAETWLKSKGMEIIRGPQNLPVNEATPGLMTAGFNSRPVMYYHYNKPYYENLLLNGGFHPIKRVYSWEVSPARPMEENLVRIAQRVIERYQIKIETWGERPFKMRKQEMLEIYNEAWSDNFGFVPFTREEFYRILDDMRLIMDKGLFVFLYMNNQPVAFFGAVPNITEKMVPGKRFRRFELLRAVRMILRKGSTKGYRLGYLAVKKEFRHLGLAGVMIWKQKLYSQEKGYEYCDMGWVLDDNVSTIKLIEMMEAEPSKTYTILEKRIA
jgi:hypothetical protein